MLVTALVRCPDCRLLYRVPTDPPEFGGSFYQDDYEQGFTTDCPSDEDLRKLLKTKFAASPKDFSERIAILCALGINQGAQLLDYGASWGYASWQFQQAGYNVKGYELSQQRARYAREKLGQNVVWQLDEIDGQYDVFFSCHVLEHVPSPLETIALAKRLLRPGGLFVAITPNGSADSRQRNAARYHRAWGMAHPQYLDDAFYSSAFAGHPLLLASSPYDLDKIRNWDRAGQLTLNLDGDELLCVTVCG